MVEYVLYKKSIIFIIGFLFCIPFCKAQDIKIIRQYFEQNDLARAKESVDSFTVLNNTNAEGFLLKSGIYNAISKDEAVKYLVADSRADAFQALQKAVQLGNSEVEQQKNIAFDLYNGYTNEAINYFNAGAERNDRATYMEALNRFKKAAQLSSFIYNRAWGLTFLDSNNIYYCSKAAIKAENEYDAVFYCKKLADKNITQHSSGKNFESIYQWLVYYYKQQKDGKNLAKYAQSGMQLFPSSVYFNLILIDWQREHKDYANLFLAYGALLKKQPDSKYQFAYLNDVFNYLYESKIVINDRSLYEGILSKGLLQYLKTNAAAVDCRLLLGKFYINKANDVGKEMMLRSTTDAKILNGCKIAQRNFLLKSNIYLKEIVNKLSKTNSVVYKEALELLILNYYKLDLKIEVRRN